MRDPPPVKDVTGTPRRLNFGCGPCRTPGWLNVDCRAGADVRCDIRGGLPLPDRSVAYAVAMHALQDLAYPDILPALGELRRVLVDGGTLRLGLPDLDRAIDAYRRRDGAYFYVPDRDAERLGAKLVTQIVWYGSVRTPFTFAFAEEQLRRAAFRAVTRCAFGRTASLHPDIVSLDNRERESLFVEAVR